MLSILRADANCGDVAHRSFRSGKCSAAGPTKIPQAEPDCGRQALDGDVVSGGVSAVSLGCVWGVSGGVSAVSLGCVWDVSGVASGVSLRYLCGVSGVSLGCLWGVSWVSLGVFLWCICGVFWHVFHVFFVFVCFLWLLFEYVIYV